MEYLYSPLDQRKTPKDSYLPQTHLKNSFPDYLQRVFGHQNPGENTEYLFCKFIQLKIAVDKPSGSEYILGFENDKVMHAIC